jgi:uncharacterized protein
MVKHNLTKKRFEFRVNEHLAALSYTFFENKLYLEHTDVPEALQGQGVARQLVEEALEYARTNKLPVVPMCPYAKKFTYQELLDASER